MIPGLIILALFLACVGFLVFRARSYEKGRRSRAEIRAQVMHDAKVRENHG